MTSLVDGGANTDAKATADAFAGGSDGSTYDARMGATDASASDGSPGDTTPPDTTIETGPPPKTGRHVVFTFSSTEAGSHFECSMDSTTAYASCSSGDLFTLTSGGGHTFRVRAIDPSGNTDPSPATWSFSVDLAAASIFPDSPTVFCSDGTSSIPCPGPGAASFGQDGNYKINVPTYTTTATTAVDSVTGLMWERALGPAATWDAQVTRCNNLTTGGFTDWRLATRLEMLTIVDAGRIGPAHDKSVFGTTTGFVWTGSQLDGVSSSAWFVNNGNGAMAWNGKTANYFGRCVRGTYVGGTYYLSSTSQSVHDARTGLTWQATPDSNTYTWLGAIKYCQSLALDGFTDWRLPNIKELQTLIDVGSGNNPPSINPIFPSRPNVEMWSSSPNPNDGSQAYSTNMANGADHVRTTSNTYQIRCVR